MDIKKYFSQRHIFPTSTRGVFIVTLTLSIIVNVVLVISNFNLEQSLLNCQEAAKTCVDIVNRP